MSFERSRAICYSRRGDPKAAIHCLLRLLEKNPQDADNLRTMGDVLEKAGKEKEAGIYYEKAAKFSRPVHEGNERNGVILTY
jgi:tetratricopeptide (TPR) repeat protein